MGIDIKVNLVRNWLEVLPTKYTCKLGTVAMPLEQITQVLLTKVIAVKTSVVAIHEERNRARLMLTNGDEYFADQLDSVAKLRSKNACPFF